MAARSCLACGAPALPATMFCARCEGRSGPAIIDSTLPPLAATPVLELSASDPAVLRAALQQRYPVHALEPPSIKRHTI
jgi:hypothetical protein